MHIFGIFLRHSQLHFKKKKAQTVTNKLPIIKAKSNQTKTEFTSRKRERKRKEKKKHKECVCVCVCVWGGGGGGGGGYIVMSHAASVRIDEMILRNE